MTKQNMQQNSRLLDFYIGAVKDKLSRKPVEAIVRTESIKQTEKTAVFEYYFDDGAVFQLEYHQTPLHQPSYADPKEFSLYLIMPPKNNLLNLEPGWINEFGWANSD